MLLVNLKINCIIIIQFLTVVLICLTGKAKACIVFDRVSKFKFYHGISIFLTEIFGRFCS